MRSPVGGRERALAAATWLLRLGLGAITGYALVRGDPGLVANSALPLAVSFLPTVLARGVDPELGPGIALWVTAAATLHAAGALWLYDAFGWYDQVAHAVSGALVAGVGYALVRAVERAEAGVRIQPELRVVFLFVFVTAFGVLWEVAEFAAMRLGAVLGGGGVLSIYDVDDIVLDLLFNAVGAAVVAVAGTKRLGGAVRLATARLRDRR